MFSCGLMPQFSICLSGTFLEILFLKKKNTFVLTFFTSIKENIIQLMHSFEDNTRICQPENSDVHRGEAEENITFEG